MLVHVEIQKNKINGMFCYILNFIMTSCEVMFEEAVDWLERLMKYWRSSQSGGSSFLHNLNKFYYSNHKELKSEINNEKCTNSKSLLWESTKDTTVAKLTAEKFSLRLLLIICLYTLACILLKCSILFFLLLLPSLALLKVVLSVMNARSSSSSSSSSSTRKVGRFCCSNE